MPEQIKRPRGFFACVLILGLLLQSASAATVRRGLGPEPDSLHIHQARGLAAINLLRDLREGLVTFDAQGEPVPGQAASWEVLDDGKRYRFSLRPDARWSNGDSVTAEDFVRAWRRAFSPATAALTAGLLKDVSNAREILKGSAGVESLGIRAVEPGVVEISLADRAPWILEILAHPVAGHSWEGFVIENLLSACPESTDACFYRASGGAEIDLVLTLPGQERWAIEIKRSLDPRPSKGFHHACETIEPEKRFVVYPGEEQSNIYSNVLAISLAELTRQVKKLGSE